MKRNRFFRILAAAVVLSLLMVLIPVVPVLAAEAVTLSPTSGMIGDEIDIYGYDFDAWTTDQYVSVYFSSDSASVGDEIGVDINTWEEVISYTYIDVDDDWDDSFDVPSSMTDGTDDESVTSGTYYVYVTYLEDVDDVIQTVDTFTVIAGEITLDDTSGYVGDTITIEGTDFAEDSEIEVFFDGDEVDITDGDTETDSSGDFECSFEVPEAVRGSHTVKVEDEDDNYDTATFSIVQKIVIDPTSGSAGTVVTVTGTGFQASQDIDVEFDDDDVDIADGDDESDSKGSFEFTFAVPASSIGTYDVDVSAGAYSASAEFTYAAAATIDQETSSSNPGYVGMPLTITGTGFTPSSTITVTYTSTPQTLGTTTADESGDFTIDITIPESDSGAHTITVKDNAATPITKTFDFYMEGDAPDAPTLLTPANSEKADAATTFTWGAVTDLSEPITYDLQVATDASFTVLLVDQTGLTTATYTIPEESKLESTSKEEPYYYRVRALDGADNASDWATARPFYVGFSFEMTGWVMWVILGAVAVVFFIVGMLIGRRTGGDYY